MDDRYLDVLDASGRTPRESGAVQFFVESAIQDATGAGMVTLLLQSAYEPCPGGAMVLYAEGEDGSAALPDSQTRFSVPALPDGRVVRWDVPVRFRTKAKTLTVEITSTIPKKASRVRQPWKVFETRRAATRDELDGLFRAPTAEKKEEPLGAFFDAFGKAISTAFGGGKAEEAGLPVSVKVPVAHGVPTPLDRDSLEKLWDLGEPMPTLPRRATAPAESPSSPSPGQPASS